MGRREREEQRAVRALRVAERLTHALDISSRDRLLIWICLGVVIALAWAYLIHLDRRMASEMEHHTMMAAMGMAMEMPAWTAADVLFTFAMWVVMMIGMMVGTAAPVLLLFAGAHAR